MLRIRGCIGRRRRSKGLGFLMAGVTFGQLPEEEADFLAYLEKTGGVWARAVSDDPLSPKYEPLPVTEFLSRYANEIVAYCSVAVYVGLRDDIFHPEIYVGEVIEGGTQIPFVQAGQVVEGVHTIVGGTKVQRNFIHSMGSRFVRYVRGQ